jgi:hypothetical protein
MGKGMSRPDGGGGGSDVEIDADAMAADADTLGQAARSVTDARDCVNSAWKSGGAAFGSSPAATAFDECCQVWVGGTDTIGQLTQYVAQYTQDVATAYGSTDDQLAAGASQMYGTGTLPEPGKHYRAPDTSNMA